MSSSLIHNAACKTASATPTSVKYQKMSVVCGFFLPLRKPFSKRRIFLGFQGVIYVLFDHDLKKKKKVSYDIKFKKKCLKLITYVVLVITMFEAE